MIRLPLGGFRVFAPSIGIPQGLYVPPDKSYRVVPPIGWAVIPGTNDGVEFRARLAGQGYWPAMFIAKEPADGSQPREGEINAIAARDRQGFRFVSGEWMDLPCGRVYVVIYEHTFRRLRMRTAEAHFVCGGVRYWVPFNAPAASFDRYFPSYLNCLRSFAPAGPDNGRVYN